MFHFNVLIIPNGSCPKRAAEFSWAILNFQKEQDVRIKFDYEMLKQVCVTDVCNGGSHMHISMPAFVLSFLKHHQ